MVSVSELHGDFRLSSGKRSAVYFDKFRFLTDPALLRDVARAVSALVPPGADLLAAPEGAATLLAAAVSLQTHLPLAIVRREPKAYGTMKQVEGHAPAGANAVLIEDVSTTGNQVLRAARLLEEEGARIVRIVLALDRGGADHLREAGYDVGTVASLRLRD